MMKGVIVVVVLLFGVALCHPLKKLLPLKAPCRVYNSNCDGDSKINDLVVKFVPDPPKIGSMMSIIIAGKLACEEEVTGGEVRMIIKVLSFPVISTEYKVCEIAVGGCPVQGGFVAITSVEIDSRAPKAEYDIELRGTDQSGGDLFCIDAKCTFE